MSKYGIECNRNLSKTEGNVASSRDKNLCRVLHAFDVGRLRSLDETDHVQRRDYAKEHRREHAKINQQFRTSASIFQNRRVLDVS